MKQNAVYFRASAIISLCVCLLLTGLPSQVSADDRSRSNVYQWWDPQRVVGRSFLHRTEDGVSATIKFFSTLNQPNHVYTFWFLVFNAPENCGTSPCTPLDIENPAAEADFLYGGGIVTGGRQVSLGGRLARDDTAGSGFIEFGFPEFALGLTDPMNAEIMLAVHSHGPAGSGDWLKSQISSYLGGCMTLVGPGGFASGPGDVPDEIGECSTIFYSIHQP